MDCLMQRNMHAFYVDDRAMAGTAKLGARKVTQGQMVKAVMDLRKIPALTRRS